MWQTRTAGSFSQVGLAVLACCIAAPVPGQTADPHELLAEADRLAWLRAWTRAEPLYAEARKGFVAAGDRRNALYAEICQLRGKLPTLAVPEVSERLRAVPRRSARAGRRAAPTSPAGHQGRDGRRHRPGVVAAFLD